MKYKYYKITGFTIIELMIGIAIGGILMAVAIPSFSDLQKNNCLTVSTNKFVTSLQLARSIAIKRNTDVTITATDSSDSDDEWGSGWTITLDEDRNGNGTLDGFEDTNKNGVIDGVEDTNGNGKLDYGEDYDGDGVYDTAAVVRIETLGCSVTTIDASPNDSAVTYESDGFIDNSGTFNICDDRTGETGRQLVITATGRPSINSGFTCG